MFIVLIRVMITILATSQVAYSITPKEGINLRIRIGYKDQTSTFEKKIIFRGKIGDRIELPLTLKKTDYLIILHAVKAKVHSSYTTQWNFDFYRTKKKVKTYLVGDIINDPRETKSLGSCTILSNYANSDNLWLEIGVDGSKYTAEQFCNKNSPFKSEFQLQIENLLKDDSKPIKNVITSSPNKNLLADAFTQKPRSLSLKKIKKINFKMNVEIQLKEIDQVNGLNRIRSVLNRRKSSIHYCYEKALKKDPQIQGQITLEWTINNQRVKQMRVVSKDQKLDQLAKCISNMIKRFRFSKTRGTVAGSFIFKREK